MVYNPQMNVTCLPTDHTNSSFFPPGFSIFDYANLIYEDDFHQPQPGTFLFGFGFFFC